MADINVEKPKATPADKVTSEPKKATRKRIPMSTPRLKLALPEISGYHVHWFVGAPDRIQAALDGGYEFVNPEEVFVTNTELGSNTLQSGNTDLGTRVSRVAGGDPGIDGQAQRLYAMKIREEWFQEDQKVLEERNDRVAQALTGHIMTGAPADGVANMGRASGETPVDSQMRYAKKSARPPELFTRGAMRKRIGKP